MTDDDETKSEGSPVSLTHSLTHLMSSGFCVVVLAQDRTGQDWSGLGLMWEEGAALVLACDSIPR